MEKNVKKSSAMPNTQQLTSLVFLYVHGLVTQQHVGQANAL
jgi:hypothetical protein